MECVFGEISKNVQQSLSAIYYVSKHEYNKRLRILNKRLVEIKLRVIFRNLWLNIYAKY